MLRVELAEVDAEIAQLERRKRPRPDVATMQPLGRA